MLSTVTTNNNNDDDDDNNDDDNNEDGHVMSETKHDMKVRVSSGVCAHVVGNKRTGVLFLDCLLHAANFMLSCAVPFIIDCP